jgi:D-glycero-D-manno-heptose 1,7-bisphosphate phosphatase
MTRPAIFMDRDGVINRAPVRNGRPHPPENAEALEILPRVPEALRALRARGFRRIVVTNQPDVARGTCPRERVERIHARLLRELEIEAIFACFHDDADGCDCRKPRPGLLTRAACDFGIDLASSFMVGDRRSDIEAGRRAGCRTFFIDYGYAEAPPASCDFRVASLLEAARIIVGRGAPSCIA